MTVEEFYQYCKERHIEDFRLFVDQISVNGCFIGYEELTPDKIDIGYSEKEIAKPPIVGTEMFQCPNCRRNLTLKNCVKKMYEYCPRCGQHLLWAKERL